ncbi:MAG: hypothetical protein ACXW1D_09535, partial [Halobacteriota archaeon]
IILGLAYLSNPQGMRQGFMRFIARIHYLFAPHPASEILKRADIDDQNDINEAVEALNEIPVEPPPIFKSENMRKKAEANTERYRKEKEHLEAWIELQETRARAEAYKKNRPDL